MSKLTPIIRFLKFLLETLPCFILFTLVVLWYIIFPPPREYFNQLLPPNFAVVACIGLLLYYERHTTSNRLNFFHYPTHLEKRLLTLIRVSILAVSTSFNSFGFTITAGINLKDPENNIHKDDGRINVVLLIFLIFNLVVYLLVCNWLAIHVLDSAWKAFCAEKKAVEEHGCDHGLEEGRERTRGGENIEG